MSGNGRRLLVASTTCALTPRPPPRLRAAATSDRQGGGGGSGRSSGSSPDLSAAFEAFVRDASPKVEAAVDDLKRSASRAASRLDSEYDLSGRASKAKRRLKEQATDVDQQWGIRRKLRVWSEDLKKAWPVWSRRFEEYASTPVGRFSVIAGVVLLMTTSFFWKVVNWLLFLWWLAIPIATFAIQKQASEQMKRAKEAAAEQEERRRDPLGSMFRRATGARRTGGGTSSADSGPVIDAEWQDVSDKK